MRKVTRLNLMKLRLRLILVYGVVFRLIVALHLGEWNRNEWASTSLHLALVSE